mmetsp:Transcript_11376/g.47555  ORF Transcript_11376/g.47555 Transcript_11376/m.47555 type:complete len:369 (+) Transcript_11376:1017-2123(+)
MRRNTSAVSARNSAASSLAVASRAAAAAIALRLPAPPPSPEAPSALSPSRCSPTDCSSADSANASTTSAAICLGVRFSCQTSMPSARMSAAAATPAEGPAWTSAASAGPTAEATVARAGSGAARAAAPPIMMCNSARSTSPRSTLPIRARGAERACTSAASSNAAPAMISMVPGPAADACKSVRDAMRSVSQGDCQCAAYTSSADIDARAHFASFSARAASSQSFTAIETTVAEALDAPSPSVIRRCASAAAPRRDTAACAAELVRSASPECGICTVSAPATPSNAGVTMHPPATVGRNATPAPPSPQSAVLSSCGTMVSRILPWSSHNHPLRAMESAARAPTPAAESKPPPSAHECAPVCGTGCARS